MNRVVGTAHTDQKNIQAACLQKNDLVVLTEVQESIDALGELHHVLDGVGDMDGTLLPHYFHGLEWREREADEPNGMLGNVVHSRVNTVCHAE